MRFAHIRAHQQQDKDILKCLEDEKYYVKSFHGTGRVFELIVTKNEKIVIPRYLKDQVLDWYHMILVHPGRDRTEKLIS